MFGQKINYSQAMRWGISLAVAQALYCFLVFGLIMAASRLLTQAAPNILNMSYFLLLLVLSVATTGVIIFGRPAWLIWQKRTKEAMAVLITTLAIILAIILIILLLALI
jgi:hypothetical protein